MRRLAGCLVVSLLASSAAWVGCHADFDERIQQLAGSNDGGIVLDTIAVLDTIIVTDGSGEGGVPDAGTTTGSDGGTTPIPDGGTTTGSDGGGEGSGSDDGGTMTGSDDGGTGGGSADGGSGGGNPLQPGGGALDRTSFYACAGGPASAGLEVGLPIGLALVLAVRRRRRFRR
jgi:hypothetical protein